MADYWKSQEKKYCDFCKCWIADNKPSRDFHENGRRHKENIKKRLKNIGKESAKTIRETEKNDFTIKAMESAAMEAYRKDVESNADLTSININKKLKQDNLAIASGSSYKVWREGVSAAGKTYYFNTLTNETIWTPPPEGYLSLKGQREQQDQQTLKQIKEVAKLKRQEGMMRTQEIMQDEAEEKARLAREELKKRRVKEDTPPPVYGPLLDSEPINPYGKWQKVEHVVEQEVDLQLPQQEYYECPVVVEPEPVVKEFKEKTFEKLDEPGESTFKKRKIGMGARRNTRKRLDDD